MMNRDYQSSNRVSAALGNLGAGSVLGTARDQFAENAKTSADASAQISGDPMTVMAILGRTYEVLCTIELATGILAGRIGDGRGLPDECHEGFPDDLSSFVRALDQKARQIEANVSRCDAVLG